MKSKKEVLTTIRVTRETMEKLQRIANRKETSVAALVREAVIIFLAKKSNVIQ